MSSTPLIVGLELRCSSDLRGELEDALVRQFSYIALPLVHPRYRTSDTLGVAKERSTAFTRSDLLLSSEEWTSRVVGVISPWVAREIDTIGRGALPQERGHGGGGASSNGMECGAIIETRASLGKSLESSRGHPPDASFFALYKLCSLCESSTPPGAGAAGVASCPTLPDSVPRG